MIKASDIHKYLTTNLKDENFVDIAIKICSKEQPEIIRYLTQVNRETASVKEISFMTFCGIIITTIHSHFYGTSSYVKQKYLNTAVEESMNTFNTFIESHSSEKDISTLMQYFSEVNGEPSLLSTAVQFYFGFNKENESILYERFLLILFHLKVITDCLVANNKKKFFAEKTPEKAYLTQNEFFELTSILKVKDNADYYFNNTGTKPEKKAAKRNDPCPCGSGKKYKKCCGRAQS